MSPYPGDGFNLQGGAEGESLEPKAESTENDDVKDITVPQPKKSEAFHENVTIYLNSDSKSESADSLETADDHTKTADNEVKTADNFLATAHIETASSTIDKSAVNPFLGVEVVEDVDEGSYYEEYSEYSDDGIEEGSSLAADNKDMDQENSAAKDAEKAKDTEEIIGQVEDVQDNESLEKLVQDVAEKADLVLQEFCEKDENLKKVIDEENDVNENISIDQQDVNISVRMRENKSIDSKSVPRRHSTFLTELDSEEDISNHDSLPTDVIPQTQEAEENGSIEETAQTQEAEEKEGIEEIGEIKEKMPCQENEIIGIITGNETENNVTDEQKSEKLIGDSSEPNNEISDNHIKSVNLESTIYFNENLEDQNKGVVENQLESVDEVTKGHSEIPTELTKGNLGHGNAIFDDHLALADDTTSNHLEEANVTNNQIQTINPVTEDYPTSCIEQVNELVNIARIEQVNNLDDNVDIKALEPVNGNENMDFGKGIHNEPEKDNSNADKAFPTNDITIGSSDPVDVNSSNCIYSGDIEQANGSSEPVDANSNNCIDSKDIEHANGSSEPVDDNSNKCMDSGEGINIESENVTIVADQVVPENDIIAAVESFLDTKIDMNSILNKTENEKAEHTNQFVYDEPCFNQDIKLTAKEEEACETIECPIAEERVNSEEFVYNEDCFNSSVALPQLNKTEIEEKITVEIKIDTQETKPCTGLGLSDDIVNIVLAAIVLFITLVIFN